MKLVIAIDGPVSAGKSTIADEVARRLGVLHLDTGAMYRALGLKALRNTTDLRNDGSVRELLEHTEIAILFRDGRQVTLLDGEDVSTSIRTQEVGMAASDVSKLSAVRDYMVEMQRKLVQDQGMVLDGRDIGTRVLPDAPFKFFLTASSEERARRRWLEEKNKGLDRGYETILNEVVERDRQDMTRTVDPLRPADDAIIVDTTELTREQVIGRIIDRVKGETC